MDDFDFNIDEFLGGIESGLDLSGGDTSWIDNFDWAGALDNLDFSGLDVSRIIDTEGMKEALNEDFWRSQYGMGQEDYEDMLAEKFWREELGLGSGEQPAITITGKREDTTQEDLASDFWKDWHSRQGYPSILTDEEHIRRDLSDDDTRSILTDEEHIRSGFGGTTTTTQDPYEVDGAQGSRDESTALTGTKTDTQTLTQILRNLFKSDDSKMLAALLGGLLGLANRPKGANVATYQGGIPKYTATRGTPRSPTAGGRRPGGAGIGSLTGGVTYTKTGQDIGAAAGGLMGLAAGGNARPARFLAGGTDGMADKIQTDIEGEQPARLSHGEFVIPADVVSHLGNGNSDAGANVLYDMMERVRTARTGNPKQGRQINPDKHLPV